MHLKSSIILVQTLAIITYIASAVIINDNHVNNNNENNLYQPRIPTPPKHSTTLPKAKIIIYFPDFHRSGGPAHFHQVHSGLNQLGFDSYFHFLNPYYADEHMKNLTEITSNEITERDIIILPANWQTYLNKTEELALRKIGTRAVVLVTGVSYPEEVELLSLKNFTQGRAIPFAHSHYSHITYQLPWDPKKFILWAPVEPFYIEEYAKYEKEKQNGLNPPKEDLICVDPDVKHEIYLPDATSHKVLFGLTRMELINVFKRSKIIYDGYLNGHEHMPREAILFDCLPALTIADNGEDRIDFPFRRSFLMDGLNSESSSLLMEGMLRDYDRILPQFAAFKKSVLTRPTTLLENLKSTFATRKYQFRIQAPSYVHEGYALIAALRILTTLPLASVQISVRKGGKYRLIRRGGALTKHLIELGLTSETGGEKYHSLRIIDDDLANDSYYGVHGDVILHMAKPYYIHNFDSLLILVEEAMENHLCGRVVSTDTDDAFVELKLLHPKGFKCTKDTSSRSLPGFTLMDLFGIELDHPVFQELVTKENGRFITSLCTDICSLSQVPLWQSTGIFPRIFQSIDTANDMKLYGVPSSNSNNDITYNFEERGSYNGSYNNVCKDYCKLDF